MKTCRNCLKQKYSWQIKQTHQAKHVLIPCQLKIEYLISSELTFLLPRMSFGRKLFMLGKSRRALDCHMYTLATRSTSIYLVVFINFTNPQSSITLKSWAGWDSVSRRKCTLYPTVRWLVNNLFGRRTRWVPVRSFGDSGAHWHAQRMAIGAVLVSPQVQESPITLSNPQCDRVSCWRFPPQQQRHSIFFESCYSIWFFTFVILKCRDRRVVGWVCVSYTHCSRNASPQTAWRAFFLHTSSWLIASTVAADAYSYSKTALIPIAMWSTHCSKNASRCNPKCSWCALFRRPGSWLVAPTVAADASSSLSVSLAPPPDRLTPSEILILTYSCMRCHWKFNL